MLQQYHVSSGTEYQVHQHSSSTRNSEQHEQYDRTSIKKSGYNSQSIYLACGTRELSIILYYLVHTRYALLIIAHTTGVESLKKPKASEHKQSTKHFLASLKRSMYIRVYTEKRKDTFDRHTQSMPDPTLRYDIYMNVHTIYKEKRCMHVIFVPARESLESYVFLISDQTVLSMVYYTRPH